jgi:hypothetical protein
MKTKIGALILIGSFFFTSCSSINNSAPIETIPQNLPSIDSYYSQELVWLDCKDDKKFECAEIQVPVDYENPGDASLRSEERL